MVFRDPRRLAALAHIVDTPPDLAGYQRSLVELTLFEVGKVLLRWNDCPAGLVEALSGSEGPKHVVVAPGGTQPPRGFISDYPLFSALAAQPAPSSCAAARSAQAGLVVAAFILATKAKLKDYAAALLSAGRSCRRICAGMHMAPGLSEALAGANSLSGALNAVHRILAGNIILSDEQRRLLGGLNAFFSDASRIRPPRRRTPTSGLRVRKSKSREVDDPTPEHEFFEEPEHFPTDEDIREGAAAVPESPGSQKVAIRLPPIFCDHAITPKQQILIAKVRSRAIASSAQGLLLSSDRLQLVDLEAMESAVSLFLQGAWKPKPSVARGAFVTSLSLLLGRSIEHLSQVVAVKDLHDVPQVFSAPHIVVSESALACFAPRLKSPFTRPRRRLRGTSQLISGWSCHCHWDSHALNW